MGAAADPVVRARHNLVRAATSLAVAMAIALFAFAVVACRVDIDGGHGFQYTHEYLKLSQAPYSPSFLRSRSFMPLLGWMCGLAGENYAYFSLIIVYLFFVATALYLMRATARISTAFMGVLLLSTLPLSEFNLYALGWPDQFCGVLYVLTLLVPSAGIFFSVAGLLAHEFYAALLLSSILIIPRPWHKRCIHLLLPLILVWLSCKICNFPPSSGRLTASVRGFLANPGGQIIGQPVLLGFTSAMKVFIVLIPCALYSLWRRRPTDISSIIVPILLAASCLLLAHDTTRLWGLALPALIVTIRCLSDNQWLLASACVVNSLLPSYAISSAWHVQLDRAVGFLEYLYISVVARI